MHICLDVHNGHDSPSGFDNQNGFNDPNGYDYHNGSNDHSKVNIEEVPVTIPAKYLDYIDIFPSDSAIALPQYTNINNHLTDLVDNKEPPGDLSDHFATLQYCSSVRKTVAFQLYV